MQPSGFLDPRRLATHPVRSKGHWRRGLLAMLLVGLAGCAGSSADAPEELRLPPLEQHLSYGGGLEWTMSVDDGCSLYVREYGNPAHPTWVILHGGWGAEHSYLLDAFEGLETEYHLVFYDQRGSLRSWGCATESISVAAHVDDLEVLRRELDLDRLSLIAHSMGGFLAGRYQQAHPDRVGDLVLIAPGLPKLPLDPAERAAYEPYIEGYHADDYEPLGMFEVGSQLLRDRPEVSEELSRQGLDADDLSERDRTLRWRVEFAATNLYRLDHWPRFRGGYPFYNNQAGQQAAMTMDELGPWDFPTLWRNHDGHVTYIIGDHDFVDWSAALSRRWFEGDEHVDLVVLERAGHYAWIDRPRAFRAALLRALRPETRLESTPVGGG